MTTEPTQTEILRQLLPVAAPGTADDALDDVEVYGPRGGFRGYERATGADRLATPMVSRVVHEAVGAVRHGESWLYDRGGPGKRASSTYGGPTFAVEDLPAIQACAWAAKRRDPDVLALLDAGDARAAVAKAVERHAAVLRPAGQPDEDEACE